MSRIQLFFCIVINILPLIIKGQGEDCATASPFCSGTTYTFPASTNTTAPTGPNYDCLGTQPNPAWYYLQIATSGNLELGISQVDATGTGTDVDFICWGPFTSPAAGCASGLTGAAVSCSYSTASIETCIINNAVTGEFYILLLTNYESTPADITLSQSNIGTAGAGSTNCNILCSMDSITANPGSCNGTTYDLTGTIYYTNPPLGGTLTISNNCSGATQIFNAPFNPSSTNYTLTGLPCNGSTCIVTAVFSGDEFCTTNKNYTAPNEAFIDCSVTAGNNSPFCAGEQLALTATDVPGSSYSWSGPAGFVSFVQNPVIDNTLPSMAGDYIVTVIHTAPACVSKDTTSVTILPTAVAKFMVTPEEIYSLEPVAYFNNLSDSSTSWFWDFGDSATSVLKNPNHIYADTGHYPVTLYAYNTSGCNDTVTNDVRVQDIITLYIPSAFSPDGNDVNDVFNVSGYGISEDNFDMWIFDRWGNQVFRTKDIHESWDGGAGIDESSSQIDMYVYRIVYKDIKAKRHTITGHVTVIR